MSLWTECRSSCSKDHTEDGIIQRYVHLTRNFEAPTSYHVFALLTSIAAATARRVVIDRGGYRLFPNLYVLLHGPSGMGKSVAADHAIGMVRAAVGEQLRRYPEDITGEGLFRIMFEQSERKVPCIGMVFADEFADLLGGQDYKAELAKRLTRLYSCPDEFGVGRAANGERWIRSVFLTILGCSQEDWLRTLPRSAIRGGLFARILTVPETHRRHREFFPEVDPVLRDAIADDLQERLKDLPIGVVQMSAEARQYAEDWYHQEDKRWAELDPIVLPWCERRMDHALKLGYINSLLEGQKGPLIIDVEGAQWGTELVEHLTPRIQAAFLRMDETPVGELHRTMDQLIGQRVRLPETKLRGSLGHRWSSFQITEGLKHLMESGQVRRWAEPNGHGMAWYVGRMVPGMEAPPPSTSSEDTVTEEPTPSLPARVSSSEG